MPNGASTYFVSQNWESNDHPDNDEGTKLKWLKKVKPHLRIHSEREIWIWMDIFSIPQKDRDDQRKAIISLPHYTQLCTRILPLVRDANRWEELYNKPPSKLYSGQVRGDIETYYQRGWCVCMCVPLEFGHISCPFCCSSASSPTSSQAASSIRTHPTDFSGDSKRKSHLQA